MTTIFPGGTTGGGSGGGTGAEGDVLGMLSGRKPRGQRTTSTQQAAQEANVPNSGGTATATATGSDTNRKRRRQRDGVLNGSTGASDEPNTYRPSIGP